MNFSTLSLPVIPAKAGIHVLVKIKKYFTTKDTEFIEKKSSVSSAVNFLLERNCAWIPAFAGMTVILFFYAFAANAMTPSEQLADPALQARADTLYKQVRCVVCSGESVADSPATVAAAERALIRERLTAGDDDRAALDRLRAVYGDAVLMTPPLRPATWLLWAMPVIILAAGGVLTLKTLRRRA
jgi:cytochrome c-type biogenesis protein CcmH